MEFVFYFFGFGVLTMGLILQFDKWQSQRINKILRETKNVQPLFLMRSAEEKLRNLNVKLYGNSMAAGTDVQSGRVYMNEGARQLITAQLAELVSSYNNGNIQLKEYSVKLTEITNLINEVKGLSFEQSQYQRPTFASMQI
jgi:hypothetical protein